jgi:hypothetical protein
MKKTGNRKVWKFEIVNHGLNYQIEKKIQMERHV